MKIHESTCGCEDGKEGSEEVVKPMFTFKEVSTQQIRQRGGDGSADYISSPAGGATHARRSRAD